MRIALVAPLFESVPPRYYGGTERIVAYLADELVRQGHDVTLFASGDSATSAHLNPGFHESLRLSGRWKIEAIPHILMLERVFAEAQNFDIIHFHIDYLHYPFCRRSAVRHITTLHGRLDCEELRYLYQAYGEMPVVSISDSQRTPLPHIAWQGTVYHGLPAELFEARDTPGDYLAFLGRISPEKRIDRAIEIAKRTGIPLKVAAKIDPVDRGYYEAEIAPLMKHPLVEYLGEIGEKEKNDFLGNAYAMLFPIDWPEPFGLVMIESIACGTPVVAFRNGSVPEIMVDGVSGYIVETVEEAAKAVFDIASLSRAKCREYFEQRFLASRMASDYVKIYRKLAAIKQPSGPLTWKVNGNRPGGSVKSPDRVRVPFNHRKN